MTSRKGRSASIFPDNLDLAHNISVQFLKVFSQDPPLRVVQGTHLMDFIYDGLVKSRKSPPLSEPEALPPGQKPLWGGA
jgi:hypothetical protein